MAGQREQPGGVPVHEHREGVLVGFGGADRENPVVRFVEIAPHIHCPLPT